MQESPDRYLDAEIKQALKFKPVVTPLQKRAARERLLARAATQTMLPLPFPEEQPLSLIQHMYIVGERTLRVLQVLLLDSSMYERARVPSPRFYEYYNPYGRYTFNVIHLSA